MKAISKRLVALGTSALMMGSALTAPAYANDAQRMMGAIGFGVGAMIGGIMSQQRRPAYRTYAPNGGAKKPSSATGGPNQDVSRDVALASLGANKNLDNILIGVAFKSVEASAGSDDSRKFGRKGDAADVKVDLPSELADFIDRVQGLATDPKLVGDVSMVTVEATLNKVYDAHEQDTLRQFELLRGGNYTPEQFKVYILQEAKQKLRRFQNGNSRGLVTTAQIEQLFMESARDVYDRTFEIAELMGMNRHVIDFDRELYEKGESLTAKPTVAETPRPVATAASGDDDAYPETSKSTATPAAFHVATQASVPQPVSKMRHITVEMLRLARKMADEIPFDQSRETRELVEAYRYRLTRATVDCFVTIATHEPTEAAALTPAASDAKATAPAALSPEQAAVEKADNRYEDLVRKFQVSIAHPATSGKDVDSAAGQASVDTEGPCFKGAYQLAGLTAGASPPQGASAASARDFSKLREPQPLSATWDGSAWKDVETAGRQP